MTVSGISSSSNSAMMEAMKKKMEEAFKAADSDGDGKLSKSEFSAFDTAMKANGAKGTDSTSGTSSASSTQGPSADDMFAAMDSDGDGSVTLSEAESFKPPMPPEGMSALLQSQEASSSSDSSNSTSNNDLLAQLMQLLSSYAQNSATNASSILSDTSSLSAVTA